MTSENNHIGSNFNDFLKEENIEITEDEIKNTLDIMFDKLCAKQGIKRCEPFIKIEESEVEK